MGGNVITSLHNRMITRLDYQITAINPLTTNVPHYIETGQLICNANHLTCFYMMENIGR